MIDESDFFAHQKLVVSALPIFGFRPENKGYVYETTLLHGDFLYRVHIRESGSVQTELIDQSTGDEYVLYHLGGAGAVGPYNGEIREATKEVLTRVKERCFKEDIFPQGEAQALMAYNEEKHGDVLDFCFDSKDIAVWRRKDNRKWYGILMTVKASKIGLPSNRLITVCNMRAKPEENPALTQTPHYYVTYHMNKLTWFTVAFDGSIPVDELCQRMERSYQLAGESTSKSKKKKR